VTGIATPLPPPNGGQENVPVALIRLLRENREVLGAQWADMAIRFVEERDAFGRRKYGQSLHTFDERSPHLDALQELVDLMQYLHKAEMEHAALVAENAGLRAKIAVLERERDARPARPAPPLAADITIALPADARVTEAGVLVVGAGEDAFLACEMVPEAECDARGRTCGPCPAYAAWRRTVRPPYEVGGSR
jgi:hypothetical protein